MTVVLIIAILLAVAIAAYVPATHSAASAACRHNQRVLEAAAVQAACTIAAPCDDLEDLRPFVRNFDTVSTCPETGDELLFDPDTLTVLCPEHP